MSLHVEPQLSNCGKYGINTELCCMKTGVDMVEALRYKLRIFGVPIYGSANVFCYNKVIYNNTITPESVLKKNHRSISYQRCR